MNPESDIPQGDGNSIQEIAPNAESLQELGALVAMTDAGLKELDSNVVEGSTGLYARKWNPESILHDHINEGKAAGTIHVSNENQPTQHHAVTQPVGAPVIANAPMAPPPPPQPVMQPAVQPVAQIPTTISLDTTAIEKKLDVITQRLDKLDDKYTMFIKLLDRSLQSGVKTVTFKLDDTKNPKPK